LLLEYFHNLESVAPGSFQDTSGANGFDGVPEEPGGMARVLCHLDKLDRGTTAANNSYALAA